MVLHKCLALATCIRSKSNGVSPLFTEFAKNPEKQTKFEGLANSVKRRQTHLDLECMQVAKARHLCRAIGPLF